MTKKKTGVPIDTPTIQMNNSDNSAVMVLHAAVAVTEF